MNGSYTPLGEMIERQLKNRGLYLVDIADDTHFTVGHILDRMKGVQRADEQFADKLTLAFKRAEKPLGKQQHRRLMNLIKTQAEPTLDLINPAELRSNV